MNFSYFALVDPIHTNGYFKKERKKSDVSDLLFYPSDLGK